jgi:hypothetical protein
MRTFLSMTVLVLLLLGCQKEQTAQNDSLTGKWKLKEYYIDPGDGSGRWQAAADGNSYIEFKTDGSVISTAPFFTEYTRFEVLNDSVVRFTDNANLYPMNVRYEFTPTQLTLYPPCIEGCGFRYTATD